MDTIALLLVPGLPLALAAALALRSWQSGLVRLVPLAPLPAFSFGLAAAPPPDVREPWLLLGVSLGVNDTTQLLLLFTALLWSLAGLYALSYLATDPHRTRFFACFLLAMAGNLGLLIAQDALSLYALFALMSFASYGVVVHHGTRSAAFAGRVYMAFVVAGELALFGGLALVVTAAGSLLLHDLQAAIAPGLALTLIVAGFVIKLGVVPLHLCLPLAHTAAPVPASAVLSGAMIKAGLVGLLAILPLGRQTLLQEGVLLIVAGLASTAMATLLGVTQRNPKTVLAYSSVSQMGLIAASLGFGLLTPAAWPALLPAVVFFAAHHGLAKAALFLGVGTFAAGRGPVWRCAVMLLLALPAATLAAAPLTSGEVAKAALKSIVGDGPEPWSTHLGSALVLSTVATTLLMARFFVVLWCQGASSEPPPRAVALPWAASIGTVLVAALLAQELGIAALPPLTAERIQGALAPLGLGISLAVASTLLLHWTALRVREIPAGEILALFERREPAAQPAGFSFGRLRATVARKCAALDAACAAWLDAATAEDPIWGRQLGGVAVAFFLAAMALVQAVHLVMLGGPPMR